MMLAILGPALLALGVAGQAGGGQCPMHRRLETLAVGGVASSWLAVGQVILAFDLAG